MKSIRSRILVNMILTVAISLLLMSIASILLNYNSTKDLLEQNMTQTASISADRVSMELMAYVNVAIEAGSNPLLASDSISIVDKQNIIDQKAAIHAFERGNIIMSNGISIFDGNDYSERHYFKEAMAGRTCVSEPLVSKRTGKLAMIISAPLWKDGIPDTEVVGVVYFAPKAETLNEIVATIRISPNASAYIIDKEGYTIAHKDIERVEQRENIEELAKTNPELGALASINANMRSGKNNFESYRFNGEEKFSAYAPIDGPDHWSIAITAPTSDFMDATVKGTYLTIFLLIISIIICAFMALKLANFIGKPIKLCADRLELLSKGDLDSPVPQINRKDEMGTLAKVTQNIVNTLNDIISDESDLLMEMSKGNFSVQSKMEEKYVGSFHSMLISLRQINAGLSDTLSQINAAADQVSSGSGQVSCGAQALAQGATQQASAVQELSSAVNEVSQQIQKNAGNSQTASDVIGIVGENIHTSNEHMIQMVHAMTEINQSSSEISKIIKTIEDIAFQTNILALNAAVEAARAGSAGKGFAVVADEVRNLASKSSEAAKQTNILIAGSVESVEKGVKIADETAKSLNEVVTGAAQITSLISEISQASEAQSTSIAHINLGVEQISAVVQTNSATSQESAASSEELNGQAQMLKGLVGSFKLKQDKQMAEGKIAVGGVENV